MKRPIDHDGELPAAQAVSALQSMMPATILVADDDELFRALLKDDLLARGYDVVEACDGAEVLAKLATAADGECAWPDVLVLDVGMPSFSGLGVLSVLRGIWERPPTLLVTGLDAGSLDTAARTLGVYRVLRKPVDREELLAAIGDAARERQQTVRRAR